MLAVLSAGCTGGTVPEPLHDLPSLANASIAPCDGGEEVWLEEGVDGNSWCIRPEPPFDAYADEALHPVLLPQGFLEDSLTAFRERLGLRGFNPEASAPEDRAVVIHVLDDGAAHAAMVEAVIREVACSDLPEDCVQIVPVDVTIERTLRESSAFEGLADEPFRVTYDPLDGRSRDDRLALDGDPVRVGSPATLAYGLRDVSEAQQASPEAIHLVNLSMAWHPGVTDSARDHMISAEAGSSNEIGLAIRAIEAVLGDGALFFAAAGNFTPGPVEVREAPMYPAAWSPKFNNGQDGLVFVSVGGSNYPDELWFSLTRPGTSPDLYALGEEAFAAVGSDIRGPMTGTSVSTAIVTGLVARSILDAGPGERADVVLHAAAAIRATLGRVLHAGTGSPGWLDAPGELPAETPTESASVAGGCDSMAVVMPTSDASAPETEACPELLELGEAHAHGQLVMSTQPKGDVVSCEVCRIGMVPSTAALALQVQGFNADELHDAGRIVSKFGVSVDTDDGSWFLFGGASEPVSRTWSAPEGGWPSRSVRAARLVVVSVVENPSDPAAQNPVTHVIPLSVFQ